MPAFESDEAPVQAKLTIGQPGDKYEQEADSMADQVMAMPEPGAKRIETPQSKVSIQRFYFPSTEASQQKSLDGKHILQTKGQNDSAGKSPTLENRLNTSKGRGTPLSKETRTFMENRFGQDFSTVRVHTGSESAQMNKDLGAQAFTHKQDVYFGAGKYSPESNSGKRLLAHELTHVIQQGDSNSLNKKQAGKPNPEYSGNQPPNIQAAWYNFNIPFTDYQFDPSIRGIKNAANIAKDTAVDTAGWVKDRVTEGFEWVFEKIKGLVSSGIDWLNNIFSEIKEFATASFDEVRNSLSSLLGYITSPINVITSAFNNLDENLLLTAWESLKNGTSFIWKGIKVVIDNVLKVGTGLWSNASKYVSSLFNRIGSVIDSWPFRQLPGFIQRRARKLFKGIRSLWYKIRNFITDTLTRLKTFTSRILTSIESFSQRVVSYGVKKVIDSVGSIKRAWKFVQKVSSDPLAFIQPTINKLAAKLNTGAPSKAIAIGQRKLQANLQENQSSATDNSIIQRQSNQVSPQRSTASKGEILIGFSTAIETAWANLNIGQMLKDAFINMFWPPATIRAIGKEFHELWSTDWANAVSSLFLPRNILKDPVGFFHDVWSNLLVLLDFPLALWRRLNNILMVLLGVITIALVIIGAVAGGIAGAGAGGVGAIPGAIAGAKAGLILAGQACIALLKSYLLAEGISVVKSLIDLLSARQTQEEKQRDYLQMAGSLIGMAMAILLVAILMFLSQLIAAVVRGIKGRFKPPTEKMKLLPKETEGVKPPKETEGVKPPKETEEVKPPKETEEVKPPKETEEKKPASGPKEFIVDSPSRIAHTEPTFDGVEYNWALYDIETGAQFAWQHTESPKVNPSGGPEMTLRPKKAVLPSGERVILRAEGFSWTTEALKKMIEVYQKLFGKTPGNLPGEIAWKNLENFQKEFIKIRSQNPNLGEQEIANQAIREISFGKRRIEIGYDDINVKITEKGPVELDGVTHSDVPTWVEIDARPSSSAQ